MNVKVSDFFGRLMATYWFVPAVMAAAAVGLSFLLLSLDTALGETLGSIPVLYSGDPDGARGVLTTTAGSMITVAGVTFSITIVALSFASSQLGARLLNSFLRDRGNQVVLGTFVSTFLYCLLVLRTVRGGAFSGFVPHLSVTFGIVLALLSIGVLIYFFHHVAASLHAEEVAAGVGRELDAEVTRLIPDRGSPGRFETEPRTGQDVPSELEREARSLLDSRSGYLQKLDYDGLLRLAAEHDRILRIDFQPGEFVPPDRGVVAVWPVHETPERLEDGIRALVILDTYPYRHSDIYSSVNQLAAMAVRALSPSLFDPFLAMSCIDQLGVALARLACKRIPSRYRYDEAGRLRLILRPFTFAGILSAAFDEIRRHSRSEVSVTMRLLETLAAVSAGAAREEDREAIRRQADMILAASEREVLEPGDLKEVQVRHGHVLQALRTGSVPP